MTQPRIVIGAGGTAGHVVPALAVADALRAEGAEVAFVGGERAERDSWCRSRLRAAPAASRAALPAVRNRSAAARAVAIDSPARPAALVAAAESASHAVLGAGGYVAGPVGLAAVLRRVPLVLMEADSHLGLTNRMLAPFARRVCLGFPIERSRRWPLSADHGPPGAAAPATDRDGGPARFGIGADETVRARVRRLAGRTVDQRGGAGGVRRSALPGAARGRRAATSAQLAAPGPHYDLRGYIADFGEALIASDLVVARSGGSIFEIAAHGRPMVLIPYPYATADHQTDERAVTWSGPARRS